MYKAHLNIYLISQNSYEEFLLQQNEILSFQQAEKCNFNAYNIKDTVSINLFYIIFRRVVDYKQDWLQISYAKC